MVSGEWLWLAVGGVGFLWLVGVSFFLVQTVNHYRKLTRGITKKDLEAVLTEILKKQETNGQKIEDLLKEAEKIQKDGEGHLQKIGLVRFNPFSETGGDQSFALAILDKRGTGLAISSLHSRDNTRIYAKAVKEGKTGGYQLSKEEAEAIGKALK